MRTTATLDDADVLAARLSALDAPSMAALERWRTTAAKRSGLVFPHFDPFDGGDTADMLLLLETPGPGAMPLRFVSQDNRGGTARNLRRFLADANIDRRRLVIWNVVPWIIHSDGARNRAARRHEVKQGLETLPDVLRLLPRLRSVVLSGVAAGLAMPVIRQHDDDLSIHTMPHPSPTYVCTRPSIAGEIVDVLTQARRQADIR